MVRERAAKLRAGSPLFAVYLFIYPGARIALSQSETPPDRDMAGAPKQLPKLDAPAPPSSGKLSVTFVGNAAFTERQLRDGIARQIRTIEESGLNEPNAYDAAYFLESYYRRNGYAQVTAKQQITSRWSLRIKVQEGRLIKVGIVTILGNKTYLAEELTKYLLGPTRERFPQKKKPVALPFVEADIQTGADLVTRLYAAEGFPQAVIERPDFAIAGDVARITLRLSEGQQYWFGEIAFIGGPSPRQELIRVLDYESGKPFTPGRLETARQKVEDYLKKRGHFTAKVEAKADRETAKNGVVPVTLILSPGPKYRFDAVTVRGVRDVSPRFVANRFLKLRGETYDPDRLDEKFREMIQTGLFKDLRVYPKISGPNLLRLEVELEEAKHKEFGLGLGFGSYEGVITSLSFTDRNFLYSARPLTIGVEYTSRGYKGEVLYSDPWFFETDYRFRARVYAQTRNLDGYSKFELGLQPTIARNLTKHWEISAFVLLKQVTLNDVSIFPLSLVGPDKYLANSIGLSTTLDYRNNLANPTRGFVGTATFDAGTGALGSEVEFLRATAKVSYYIPVTPKTVLAFGARGGVISPMGASSGDLPIDERFFSGGASSVRSFMERELGPKDRNGVAIGGEAFTVLNVEYTFPIVGDLKGALFTDAGNVRPRAGDFGLGDLRYGVGAGLRYNLPFGPIRLDYGHNPSPKQGEDSGAFHFSIGVAF